MGRLHRETFGERAPQARRKPRAEDRNAEGEAHLPSSTNIPLPIDSRPSLDSISHTRSSLAYVCLPRPIIRRPHFTLKTPISRQSPEMHPRPATVLFRTALLPRIRVLGAPSRRPYSQQSDEPLIRVTNVPAPNSGHIRILELNRAPARNAISRALLASLRAEVDDVAGQYGPGGEELPPKVRFGGAAGVDEKGPTRAVVLASTVGTSFCAGADLKERRGFTKEEYGIYFCFVSSVIILPVPVLLSHFSFLSFATRKSSLRSIYAQPTASLLPAVEPGILE